ncbi:MAG TPA: hypothetical protein ENK43_13950 [Planctomycetes bacterium]|nr:hypothetical protein [Planctomycetota bacterium]
MRDESFPSMSAWAFALALGALAAGVAGYALGYPSLQLDDSFAWYAVDQSWSHLFLTAREGHFGGGLLYGVLLKLVHDGFGSSEIVLRAPGVLLTALAVAFTARVGWALGGWRTSLMVAVLLGLHPQVIDGARHLKPYPLLIFATALGLWGLQEQVLTRGERGRWMTGLAGWLAVLSHGFGLATWAGLAGALIAGWSEKGFGPRVQMMKRQAPLLSALLPFFVWQLGVCRGAKSFLSSFWNHPPLRRAFFDLLHELLIAPWAVGPLLILLLVAGTRLGKSMRTVAAFTSLGAAAVLGASLLTQGRHHFVVTRYFLFLLPALTLILAYPFGRLPRWAAPIAALALVLTAARGELPALRAGAPTGPHARNLVRTLVEEFQPGDTVILYPGHEMPTLRYYGFHGKLELILHPRDWRPWSEHPPQDRTWIVLMGGWSSAPPRFPDADIRNFGPLFLIRWP